MSISAVESERYDRQIRLWGKEAQGRMQKSRVLIVGLGGLNCEAVKNLVLAGLSVTLLDHGLCSETDLQYNFFLTRQELGENVRTNYCAVITSCTNIIWMRTQ
jgi:ubiquitin-like 1-activating enzyme E1 A